MALFLLVAFALPGPVSVRPAARAQRRPARSASVQRTDATWHDILARATNLGATRSPRVSVLVSLRSPRRPRDLLAWASGRDLQATWFHGQATALLVATPTALDRALQVRIDDFRLPGEPVFYATERNPAVPAGVRGELAAIGRISSFGHEHLETIPIPIVGLAPAGFVDSYDARPLWNLGDFGQGETIVFFEVDGYSAKDLATYDAHFGLPALPDPLTHIGGLRLPVEGESDMDIEVAHAIAPDARLVYVNLESFARSGASAAGQFEQAFSTVATRYPGAIWSVSLGQCEYLFSPTDLRAVDGAVKHAEQSGTTVFAASGDSAGLECLGIHDKVPEIPAVGISFPGDLPHVTSVGGTALDLSTSGRYLLETSWTEPMLSLGSTGGQSSIFARPAWQQAPGVVGPYSDGAICGLPTGATCREVPDVSADADPSTGAAVRVNGKWLADGGTSLATPLWAAFMALVDQYLGSRGQPPAGFLNPLLYRLARATPASPTFHDVTLGANDVYLAGVGYDMVTGLGTSRIWNLARDLAAIPGRS